MKVICSDCGKKFEVEIESGEYTPDSCPGCNHLITEVTNTPTSEEKVAWVEE